MQSTRIDATQPNRKSNRPFKIVNRPVSDAFKKASPADPRKSGPTNQAPKSERSNRANQTHGASALHHIHENYADFFLQRRTEISHAVFETILTLRNLASGQNSFWVDPETFCVYSGPKAGLETASRHGPLVELSQFLANTAGQARCVPPVDTIKRPLRPGPIRVPASPRQSHSNANPVLEKSRTQPAQSHLLLPDSPEKNQRAGKPDAGCKCSKSRCLRLQCRCFRNSKTCGDACKCESCFNTQSNQDAIDRIRAKTKQIRPNAFETPVVQVDFDGSPVEFTTGCQCAKSQCVGLYCTCRRHGLNCSPLCRCSTCKNGKVNLDPSRAQELYQQSLKYARRKKNSKVPIEQFFGGSASKRAVKKV